MDAALAQEFLEAREQVPLVRESPVLSVKKNLLDLDPRGLEAALADLGKEKFRARQVLLWVYDKGVDDFSKMSNLAKDFREALAAKFEVRLPKVVREQKSGDGTVKWLFEVGGADTIESVLIPEDDRITLCVSSQVGCAMGCTFCATAQMGLKRNLTVAEVVGQILYAKRATPRFYGADRRLSNIVFMGMGEPLQNWPRLKQVIALLESDFAFKISNRRITVSTSGLIPQIKKLGEESDVNLALSLNASRDESRREIMPVNKAWDMAALRAALLEFPRPSNRKVTIEYVLLSGVNDSVEDARRLGAFLRGIPCKINLIPFNEFPGSKFTTPDPESVLKFQQVLHHADLNARIRTPRGRDIAAACGMLQGEFQAEASR